MQPDGMYAHGLARSGIRLQTGRDIDVMGALSVSDAMITPAPTIQVGKPLVDLRDGLRKSKAHGLVVVDDQNKVVGIATLSDLRQAYEDGKGDANVGEMCVRDVVTATPDEPLWRAMRNMGQRAIERLPVIDPVTSEPAWRPDAQRHHARLQRRHHSQDRAAAD